MGGTVPEPAPRLTELLAAASLATDLVTGQPLEHALHTCLLSTRVARALGVGDVATAEIRAVALLRFLGCTADMPEMARMAGGDNIAFMAAMGPVTMGAPTEQLHELLRSLGRDLALPRRMALVTRALRDPRGSERSLRAHCEVAARLAGRLAVGDGVVRALGHGYERWDGHGLPDGLAGDDVPLAVRVVIPARDAVLWRRIAGEDAARAVLRRRRGRAYDPEVVDALLGVPLAGESDHDAWHRVLQDDAAPDRRLGPAELDRALAALGDFADLRSAGTAGRSARVAHVAAAAAAGCGLSRAEVTSTRRAGWVADLGAVGVPAGVWTASGPLGLDALERVRLHPYVTERVLGRCTGLGRVATLAGAHHERLDGSGYHRGSAGAQVTPAARVLAAADVWTALREHRAHRPAHLVPAARAAMSAEVAAGRLDREAVQAVLAAAGGPRVPRGRPGLSDREVEVLRQLARGATNRQIASRLSISSKTVGRHVENVYAKAGVSCRAAAALYASEHGLLG